MDPKPRVRRRVQTPGGGRMMTKQSDALQSDINAIMAKWIKTGSVVTPGMEPKYGDFTSIGSFQECKFRVAEAEEQFMEIHPAVRKRCANDVGVFLEMVQDPEGLEELLGLGLDPDRVPPEPSPDPVPPQGTPEVPSEPPE